MIGTKILPVISGAQHSKLPQPPWQGTLLCDQYAGYIAVLDTRVYPQRKGVKGGCFFYYVRSNKVVQSISLRRRYFISPVSA